MNQRKPPQKTPPRSIELFQENISSSKQTQKLLQKPIEHPTTESAHSRLITGFKKSETIQAVSIIVACFVIVFVLCLVFLIESIYYHDHTVPDPPHYVVAEPDLHSESSRGIPSNALASDIPRNDPLCDSLIYSPFNEFTENNTITPTNEFSTVLLTAVSKKFDHFQATRSILETDTEQYYEYLYKEYYSPDFDKESIEDTSSYDPVEILDDVKTFHSWCLQGISRYSGDQYSHVGMRTIRELKKYVSPSFDVEGLLAYLCSRGHIAPFCVTFVTRQKSLFNQDSLILTSGINFGSTDLMGTIKGNSKTTNDNQHFQRIEKRVQKMSQLGLIPGTDAPDSTEISTAIYRIERHLSEISRFSFAKNVDPNSLLFDSDTTADNVNHETMVLFMNMCKKSKEIRFHKDQMNQWMSGSVGFSLDKYLDRYSEYYHLYGIDTVVISDGVEYFEHLFEMIQTLPRIHFYYYLIHCAFYSVYDTVPLVRKPINLPTMEYSLITPWKSVYRMEPPYDNKMMTDQFCHFMSWGYMSEHLSYLSCLISGVDKCSLNELHSSIIRAINGKSADNSSNITQMHSCASLLETYPRRSPNLGLSEIITQLQLDSSRKKTSNSWDSFSELLSRLLVHSALSPVSQEYNYAGPTYDLLSETLIIPVGWNPTSYSNQQKGSSQHFETVLYSSGLFECLKQIHKGSSKKYSSYITDPEKLSMFSVSEGKRRLENEIGLSELSCDIGQVPYESIQNHSEIYEELYSATLSLNLTLSMLKSTGIYKLNPRDTLRAFFQSNFKHRASSAVMSFLENISAYSDYLGISEELSSRLVSLNDSGYLWHLRRYKLLGSQERLDQSPTYLWEHHDHSTIPVEIQMSLEEALKSDDLAFLDVFWKDRLVSQCVFLSNPDFLKSLDCQIENQL